MQREMPKYKCHKEVWALKIKEVVRGSTDTFDAKIRFEEEGYGEIIVDDEFLIKHRPRAGGYYVVYQDGYRSYSPSEAFESGYSLISPGD